MQTSIFIAKLIGPAMAVIGVALLANREAFIQAARETMESPAHLVVAGMLALVLGLVLVNTHNHWDTGWPVIITLLGWMSVAAGIMRLVFPDQVRSLGAKMVDNGPLLTGAGVLYLGLGAVLSYFGYIA